MNNIQNNAANQSVYSDIKIGFRVMKADVRYYIHIYIYRYLQYFIEYIYIYIYSFFRKQFILCDIWGSLYFYSSFHL